jgi:hypothetical protein
MVVCVNDGRARHPMGESAEVFAVRAVAPKGGRSRGKERTGEAQVEIRGERCARAAWLSPRALSLFTQSNMTTNLAYAITRRTPVSPKVLQWAMRAQSLLNEKTNIPHDRLNLAPISGASERPVLNFPFVRVLPMKIGPYSAAEPFGETSQMPNSNAVAAGSTKVRDLWSAHVVGAFLRVLSEQHPDVVLELRDETGQFVIPMGVFIRGGRFEINRELLNAQRERVLEASGDPQAGAGFLWAESRALNGEFLTDVPVSDYMEVPEIVLDMDRENFAGASVGELATYFVRRMLSELTPHATR